MRIFRFFKGYVTLKISGSMPERFVNVLTQNGVSVWGVKSIGGNVFCRTSAGNFKYIKKLVKHKSVRVHICEKYGLPFIVNRHKNRKGLLVGGVLFLAVFNVLSLFVWNIDVYGFENMSVWRAKNVMESVGVYEGVYNKFSSLRDVQNKALIAFGDVSWITVNIDGSSGEVNISETIKQGDVQALPCNIVADCEAQIIRVDAQKGMAVVKSGDAVAKGNLLISGFVKTPLGSTVLDTAQGAVIAKTVRTQKIIIPKEYTYKSIYSDGIHRRNVRVYGLLIPLSFQSVGVNSDYLSFVDEERFVFREKKAAFSFVDEDIYYYGDKKVILTENAVSDYLNTELLLREVFEYGDKKIIGRNIKITAENDNYNCIAQYNCEEDIGVKKEIIFDTENSAEYDE
ncbi:MAG: sporulation protein YqfD [Clostridia bacterium]|nr:sporulation protein YqfD [Clostridia bacterium]